jgi:hypothetical protein
MTRRPCHTRRTLVYAPGAWEEQIAPGKLGPMFAAGPEVRPDDLSRATAAAAAGAADAALVPC